MKYLVYLPPNQQATREVQHLRERVQPHILRTSDNVLHTTLYVLHTDEAHEPEIHRALGAIELTPAHCRTSHVDLFTPDALVLRLEHTSTLISLHEHILDALLDIRKELLPPQARLTLDEQMARQFYGSEFFGPFYNPHLTIARVNPETVNPHDLDTAPVAWRATQFHLAKKTPTGWQDLHTYALD